MIPWDICKNWIVQNENWEIYLLSNTALLCSCLRSLPLNWFWKLFCMIKVPNVYVFMKIYDRISTSSVIVSHYIFHSNILVFTKILLILA